MHKKLLQLFLSILIVLSLASCKQYKYRIGISQCGKDAWHAKMTQDLVREANSHPDVEMLFRVSEYSTEEQQANLEDLLAQNVDLLIVSPNHADALVPIIEKFYDRGIPVIVVDRALHSTKYTASVSSDNHDIGERIGNYIASSLAGHGRILEITGTSTTSTSIERHRGLMSVLSNFPDIIVEASVSADWSFDKAVHFTDSLLRLYPDVDLIAAHNDVMASGAYEACRRLGMEKIPSIVGVDGLPNQGLSYILEDKLQATCANPSGASQAFHIALHILNGEPYERENVLSTLLVDKNNVSLVMMHSDMLEEYNKKIEEINGDLGFYWRRNRLQQMLLASLLIILGLVVSIILMIYRHRREQDRLRIKNLLLKLSQIEERANDKAVEEPLHQEEPNTSEEGSSVIETVFVTRLHEYILTNMSRPDLNVNDLCGEMNMSRVQLYRKCKAQTDFSPVEFIRIIRLKHAKHLLETTQLSISEIAYEVGFSSPSYFAKCYRDQYNVSPTELRRNL